MKPWLTALLAVGAYLGYRALYPALSEEGRLLASSPQPVPTIASDGYSTHAEAVQASIGGSKSTTVVQDYQSGRWFVVQAGSIAERVHLGPSTSRPAADPIFSACAECRAHINPDISYVMDPCWNQCHPRG